MYKGAYIIKVYFLICFFQIVYNFFSKGGSYISKVNFKSNKNIFILTIFVILLFSIFISLVFFNNKLKKINNKDKVLDVDLKKNINLGLENVVNVDAVIQEGYCNNVSISEKNDIIDTNYSSYSTITIPAISLYDIKIKDGIDVKTLNEYVGHFPSTSNFDGNVGLAAHNSGFKNNFFKDINKLNLNDSIIYKYNGEKRQYKVVKKVEIDSYDWSYLDNTNDNTLTLITCVKNMPNKRLVVQAVE